MNIINSAVCGFSAVSILFFGIYLTFKTNFLQFGKLAGALKTSFSKKKSQKSGGITSRGAMCTSLAATIGTGNIAGVSGAVAIGGAGVVFWIFLSAAICMIIKYFEIHISMLYRKKEYGVYKGGTMYTARALPYKFHFLGTLFALFTVMASFGTGNLIQVNTAAQSFKNIIPDSVLYKDAAGLGFSAVLAISIGFILISGIKKVSVICEKFVPFMLVFYLAASFFVIGKNIENLPLAFGMIIKGAFNPKAVTGGAVSSFFIVAKTGILRGIISNESGLGTASLTHSAAENDNIDAESKLGIAEVFTDTVICILTALVILVSRINIPYGQDIGIMAVAESFRGSFGVFSDCILSLFLILFAVSSILGWGAYGIIAAEFLWGKKGSGLYKIIFASACILGAVLSTEKIWGTAELLNSLMAFPNIAVMLLVLTKNRALLLNNNRGYGIIQ